MEDSSIGCIEFIDAIVDEWECVDVSGPVMESYRFVYTHFRRQTIMDGKGIFFRCRFSIN